MKTRLVLLTLLFLAAQSPAKVLIYKGTVRSRSDTNTAFPRTLTVFEIIDPAKSLVASVITFLANGKNVQLASPPTDMRFVQAPLPNGTTTTIISLLFINGGSNDFFEHITLRLRGANKPLRFKSQFTENFATFPRVITGTAFDDEAFNGVGSFVEQKTLLAYQEGRSVIANDSNLTAQQALDGLVAELKAKGFEAAGS